MKKEKRRWCAWALMALGLLLALPSLGFLMTADDLLQYAIVAPSGEGAADEIASLLAARETIAETLGDSVTATAVGGLTGTASVSAGEKSASAVVYAGAEGWFEIYPVALASGRRITETELRRGDRVIMLDSDLAFTLFGAEIPEDAEVRVLGESYAVVGTFRHRRDAGEVSAHAVCLPLRAAGGGLETMLFSAKPVANAGARTLFESAVRDGWQPGGSLYSIEKEAMRRTMIPRMMLLVFGMSALMALLRGMNGVAARGAQSFRAGMRVHYFPKMIPRLMGLIGLCIAGYGALAALLYGLMTFTVEPLYVFTEWVPENIVAWSSLRDVFWNLTSSAAQLVKVGTPQMRRIEFAGGLLRWGCLLAAWAALLLKRRARAER